MGEEKTGKLRDLKETVSGTIGLLQNLGNPEVQESFGKILDAAMIAKDIVKDLKTPEMVRNIENFYHMSENMNKASERIQNTLKHLEETGVINQASGLIKSAKNTMDLFSEGSQELPQMSASIKEMVSSVRDLVNELKMTIIDSKNSGVADNIKETIHDASEIYKTAVSYKGLQ